MHHSLISLLFCTGLALARGGHWDLSEVLADPVFAADADAEYLEFTAAGETAVLADTLRGRVNGKSLRWFMPSDTLGATRLICRDTVAALAAGLPCHLQASGFSLANAQTLLIEIFGDRDTLTYVVPAGRPGESQENENVGSSFSPRFRSSLTPYRGGFASPGKRGNQTALSSLPGTESVRVETEWNPETLTEPRLSTSHWILGQGRTCTIAWPQAFAGGLIRLLSRSGKEMWSQNLPSQAGQWVWKEEDLIAWALPAGPYLLQVKNRSRFWMKAVVVTGERG